MLFAPGSLPFPRVASYDIKHAYIVGWNDKDYDYHTEENPADYFSSDEYLHRSLPLPASVDPSLVPRDIEGAKKFGGITLGNGERIPLIAEEKDGDAGIARDKERDRALVKFLKAAKQDTSKPEGSLVYDLEKHRMKQVDRSYPDDVWSLYFPPKRAMWMTRHLLTTAAMKELNSTCVQV